MGTVITNSELFYSAAWLASVFLVPFVVAPAIDFWMAMALTATVVAFFHAFMLWAAHYQQQNTREAVVKEVRVMLQDDVKNKLAAVKFILEEHLEADGTRGDVEKIPDVLDEIAVEMDTLTEKTVDEWKARYETGSR